MAARPRGGDVKKLVIGVFAVLMGCDSAGQLIPGGEVVDEQDVEAITPGTAQGALYSGTWVLDTTVTVTNCDLFNLAGDVLPKKGEKDDEDVVLLQNGGEFTRAVDDLGSAYTFKGGVDQDGSFTYGIYYDLQVGVKYIEVTRGTMKLSGGGGQATLTGTSVRRYLGAVVDCSATMSVTGKRTLIGG